jgi:hypothetical protein
MTFSADMYRRAVADYNRSWRTTDQTLYSLCRQHPGHGDQAGVNAKLWIIGRTYATGIERKIPTNGKQGGSMAQLAGHLLEHARELDALFARLRRLEEPLDPTSLRTILDLHGQFIAMLLPVLRPNQLPRSFASKYMHFHCPAVPIIDTYADRACRKLIRWQKSFCLFDLPAGADEYYAWYVLRFWQLYQQARAAGLQPTVKHLDYYLLCTAEDIA